MLLTKPELLIPLCIAMLLSLTLHEWAHAWTAYRLGDNTAYHEGRVTLNPLAHLDWMGSLCFLLSGGIGWAKPVPVNPARFRYPRRDDILVTAAGPFSNLVLGMLSGLLFLGLLAKGVLTSDNHASSTHQLAYYVLYFLTVGNFSLAFFNLIPLFPLDGSHIATNLLPLEQAYHFKRFNQTYGPMILLGLFVLGTFHIPLGSGIELDPIRWWVRPPTDFCINLLRKIVYWLF